MPTPLNRAPSAPADDPLGMLLECHQKIRGMVDVAGKLATPPADSTPEMISSAASDVIRYFNVALPLHEQDEETSIVPRLEGKTLGAKAAQALELLHEEHREIDALLSGLTRRWREIAGEPERLGTLRGVIGQPTARLKSLFDSHLEKEERDLLPAVRKALSAKELDAVRDEIRARRR